VTTTAEIWELIEPYLAAEHLVLDDIELTGIGKGRVLRVAVDGDGVDVDRLAELSRGISRLLDNEVSLEGSYQLEVTTPGLERKLRRPEHYQKSVGREVVATVALEGANKTVRGVIADAGASTFTVEGDNGPEEFSYDTVVKAKTVFRWEKSPKPGH
jgi:ribosome maturation factor RimP